MSADAMPSLANLTPAPPSPIGGARHFELDDGERIPRRARISISAHQHFHIRHPLSVVHRCPQLCVLDDHLWSSCERCSTQSAFIPSENDGPQARSGSRKQDTRASFESRQLPFIQRSGRPTEEHVPPGKSTKCTGGIPGDPAPANPAPRRGSPPRSASARTPPLLCPCPLRGGSRIRDAATCRRARMALITQLAAHYPSGPYPAVGGSTAPHIGGGAG